MGLSAGKAKRVAPYVCSLVGDTQRTADYRPTRLPRSEHKRSSLGGRRPGCRHPERWGRARSRSSDTTSRHPPHPDLLEGHVEAGSAHYLDFQVVGEEVHGVEQLLEELLPLLVVCLVPQRSDVELAEQSGYVFERAARSSRTCSASPAPVASSWTRAIASVRRSSSSAKSSGVILSS